MTKIPPQFMELDLNLYASFLPTANCTSLPIHLSPVLAPCVPEVIVLFGATVNDHCNISPRASDCPLPVSNAVPSPCLLFIHVHPLSCTAQLTHALLPTVTPPMIQGRELGRCQSAVLPLVPPLTDLMFQN